MAKHKRCCQDTWAFSLLSHQLVWHKHDFTVYSEWTVWSRQAVESAALIKCGRERRTANKLVRWRRILQVQNSKVSHSYPSVIRQGDVSSDLWEQNLQQTFTHTAIHPAFNCCSSSWRLTLGDEILSFGEPCEVLKAAPFSPLFLLSVRRRKKPLSGQCVPAVRLMMCFVVLVWAGSSVQSGFETSQKYVFFLFNPVGLTV